MTAHFLACWMEECVIVASARTGKSHSDLEHLAKVRIANHHKLSIPPPPNQGKRKNMLKASSEVKAAHA